MLYIVNRSDGWRLQPHSAPVPPGEVVDIPEEIGEDAVDQGYLIGDYPNPYLTDEHKAKLVKYRQDRKPESPERKKRPERAKTERYPGVPETHGPAEETGGIEIEIEEPEPTASENVASLPVMITQKLRRDLRSRGFADADIDKMTPQEAHDALK